MADGSRGDRTDPKQINDSTFSEPKLGHGDTKKCSDETFSSGRLKLSFYTELDASESCENSDTGTRGVAGDRCEAAVAVNKLSVNLVRDAADERKRRCIERYDSSESSDSGVAVLSPTESGGCSGSDITEPRSPRSPASSCSNAEDSAGERMPPWASDPAPPGQRRIAVQPAPTRRPPPPAHRRITEFFNHKMKPQNGVKRDANGYINEDTKRKCLPKNGVTNELEKYICYLSQTLSPKVLLDVGKQAEAAARKPINTKINAVTDNAKVIDLNKSTSLTNGNEAMDCRPKDNKDKLNTSMNGFVEVRHATETSKEKFSNGLIKGMQKHLLDSKMSIDPSANGFVHSSKLANGVAGKVPIPASTDACGMRAPAASLCQSPKKTVTMKPDTTRVNGVVSSTTKLGNPMNGVTCGSNNLSLNSITNKSMIQNLKQKETPKKVAQPTKRTNRKSSACIANSKNLTWSKANNLKQVQLLQKQNCMNSVTTSTSIKTNPGEINTTPKINIPNGVRQISMAVNGNLGNLNLPASNYPNCHQINIPQPCNGTVSSNNLASFVAVPHNVMLTTLRIPQNGLPAQTLSQQNNMSAFNRQNMNVSSPTKLNGQLVFPFVQNINGTVVQIPNIMAKMPNFVLPQNSQLAAQRQDHLQNQQAAQFLINGTLLKLANTMPSPYTNKTGPVTSQPLPTMNKNVTGMQSVEMSVQPKATNYTVNLSHPVLVPQPGYIVTSVPNLNVKETWSYTSTNTVSSSQATCSNPLIQHHPSLLTNFATHTLHSSSIPIAPVKPPDNPIQGTDPPSSTVKEPENCELLSQKCDIPWLSKTVNNNIVPLDSNKMCSRPFAELSNLSKKFEESSFLEKKIDDKEKEIYKKDTENVEMMKVDDISREETMFTQITVLKDVLSEVQSTVIEANFSSATTESSESGIGTDKSIDSPSDSQTSKECDEDSSLSLSVSVCSVDVPSCQKSPILKQPKTLRFPPRQPTKADSDRRKSSSDTTATVTICLWEDCKKELESDNDLLEHLQTAHVDTQQGKKNFVCLWERCKVRGKPSCSRLWLERHASSHGGNKPFKCIVDSCGRRFSTQILLERHVNNHLDEASPNTSGGKKATDSAPKLIRRNGKKLRYRRQPWSARMFDFFDSGAMEGLAWRLARSTRWRLGGACPLREARDAPAGHALTLHAALAATRYNAADGRREALLTYYPPNVVEDEWVAEADVKRVKRVEISRLPAATKVLLYDQFCASYRKAGSPPPAPAPAAAAARLQPPRTPASSRLLNNLLAKQKTTEPKDNCSATNLPMVYREEEKTPQVSGARKRKLGRRHGGDCFWPCGR